MLAESDVNAGAVVLGAFICWVLWQLVFNRTPKP